MEEHTKLKKLVFMTMEGFRAKEVQPTANALYKEVVKLNNYHVGTFRSFVKILNQFPEIKKIQIAKGKEFIYDVKRNPILK